VAKRPCKKEEKPIEKVQVQVSGKVIMAQQKGLEESKKKAAQFVEKEQAQVSNKKARIDKVGSMQAVEEEKVQLKRRKCR